MYKYIFDFSMYIYVFFHHYYLVNVHLPYFLINIAHHTYDNGANSNSAVDTVDANKMLGVLGRMAVVQELHLEASRACMMAVLDHVGVSGD